MAVNIGVFAASPPLHISPSPPLPGRFFSFQHVFLDSYEAERGGKEREQVHVLGLGMEFSRALFRTK